MVVFAKRIFIIMFIFLIMIFIPFIISDLNFTWLTVAKRNLVEIFLFFAAPA